MKKRLPFGLLSILGLLIVVVFNSPACNPSRVPMCGVDLGDASFDGDNRHVGGYQPWGASTGGTPGGSNTQIQYNSSGAFAGSASMSFDGTSINLTNSVGSVNFGSTSTQAATGRLRGQNNEKLVCARNAANSADIVALATNGSNELFVGSDSASGNRATNVYITPTTTGTLATSGTAQLTWTSGVVQLGSSVNLQLGTSVATSGTIRAANATTVLAARNVGATDDINIVTTDASNRLFLGTDTSFTTAKQASVINIFGSSSVDLGVGSGDYLLLTSDTVQSAKPIVGEAGASSPYGAHGQSDVAIPTGGASKTLAAAEYSNAIIHLTGACSGALSGPIHLPSVADSAHAYWKIVRGTWTNGCGNQPTMVIDVSGGTSVTIAINKTAIIGVDSSGAFRISPDT